MKVQTIINVIANGVLAAGVSAFMVMIYRTGGLIERWPKASSLTLRLSLAGTAAGALGNCLTLSTPADTEILMNCGLAGIFVWAAVFHANLIKHGPITQHQSGPDEGSSGQTDRPEGPNL